MATYLLDADVFIQAKNAYYGFDFCPAFWDWLIQKNTAGLVASVAKVGEELKGHKDELKAWSAARGSGFFLPMDRETTQALGRVSNWANGQNYTPNAVSTFLAGADYYLVAHALAHGGIVVTRERTNPGRNNIKIPDACDGLNIRSMNTYDMLRKGGARFVLRPSQTAP